MAYVGTSAASSLQNLPFNLVNGIATQGSPVAATLFKATAATSPDTFSGGMGLWMYQSSDPTSTITGTATYFTDGLQLGMRNGHAIICQAATSLGSTVFLMGLGILYSTNSTAGFSVVPGGIMYSTA
jgi:hypothetical protein